jgi:hypothetical protein
MALIAAAVVIIIIIIIIIIPARKADNLTAIWEPIVQKKKLGRVH